MAGTPEAGYWAALREHHHDLSDAYSHVTVGELRHEWGHLVHKGEAIDFDNPQHDLLPADGLVTAEWSGLRLGPILVGRLVVRDSAGGNSSSMNFLTRQYMYGVAPMGDSGLLKVHAGIWEPDAKLQPPGSTFQIVCNFMSWAYKEARVLGFNPTEEQYSNFAVEMAQGVKRVK